MRRWGLFAAGVAASVAITALLWSVGMPGFFLFLAFPLLLFPFGRRAQAGDVAPCPACGAHRERSHSFCPRCGTRRP